jgi:hypothetical protein
MTLDELNDVLATARAEAVATFAELRLQALPGPPWALGAVRGRQ